MPTLVLTGEVIGVKLESRRFIVFKRDEHSPDIIGKMSVPIYDIDRTVIIGRPNFSTAVLQKLMFSGIPTFFITSKGRWIGSLHPDNNQNAGRRILQYKRNMDKEFSLKIARKIVYSKIRNSRRVLQRLAANRDISHQIEHQQVCEAIKQLANSAPNAQSLDELRGYEGMAAAYYFKRLSQFFPEDIPFNGRNRRPPKDEANAMLSWTYSIVQGEIDATVRSHGLDSCIGFLHEVSHGTPSLTLDLLECFRAPLCDLLVLNLLNHKVIKKEDFNYDVNDSGVYLNRESHRDFFSEYERYMTRKFILKKGESHTTFRKIIEQSVIAIINALNEKEFDFFLMP